ncbi:MAG: DUF2480 family protein [Flavicella sp.]
MEEIVNRVAQNKSLTTIDLEDFYPKGQRVLFDIRQWLYQDLILKEKDFREAIETYDWASLQDCYVALTCSVDAIIPSWAYMLITTKATPYAKKIIVGDLNLLETVIYEEIINSYDASNLKDKRVIVKGCANKPIPASAYTQLVTKIYPLVKSIMFGEACSTVPLYKSTKPTK